MLGRKKTIMFLKRKLAAVFAIVTLSLSIVPSSQAKVGDAWGGNMISSSSPSLGAMDNPRIPRPGINDKEGKCFRGIVCLYDDYQYQGTLEWENPETYRDVDEYMHDKVSSWQNGSARTMYLMNWVGTPSNSGNYQILSMLPSNYRIATLTGSSNDASDFIANDDWIGL